VDVVGVTMEIAEVRGQLRGELRRRGQNLVDDDLLIASTVLYFGMTLFTGNVRHVERVAALGVIAPPPPPV
jgi:predicted nucleic acid-binding protein